MAAPPTKTLGHRTQTVCWSDPPCSAVLRKDLLPDAAPALLEPLQKRLPLLHHLNHATLLRCLNAQLSAETGLSVWMEHADAPSLRQLLGLSVGRHTASKFGAAPVNSIEREDEYVDSLTAEPDMQQTERELLALINETTIEDVSDGSNSKDQDVSVLNMLSDAPSRSFRKREHDFTEKDIWSILAQLLSVVAYLHSSVKDIALSDTCLSLPHGRITLDSVFYTPKTCMVKLVPPHLADDCAPNTVYASDAYSIYAVCAQICGISAGDLAPFGSRDFESDLVSIDCRRFSTRLTQVLLSLRTLCSEPRPALSSFLLVSEIKEALLPITCMEFGKRECFSEQIQTRSPLEIYKSLKEAASMPSIKYVNDPIYFERSVTTRSANTGTSTGLGTNCDSVLTGMSRERHDNLSELLRNLDSPISDHRGYNGTSASTRDLAYPRVASVFSPGSTRGTTRMDSSVDFGVSILQLSTATVGNTMLHKATLDRDIKTLGRHLDYAKRFNHDGHTALMLCAMQGWVEGAKLLVFHEGGLFTQQGETALFYALKMGHYNVARLLTEAEGLSTKNPHIDNLQQTDLMRAAIENDLVGVWSWHSRQHKWKDVYGKTALMYAIESKSSIEIVKLLAPLEGGITDKNGRTALHRAAEMNLFNEAQVLLPYEKGILYSSEEVAPEYITSPYVSASEIAYLHRDMHMFNALFPAERPFILKAFCPESQEGPHNKQDSHPLLIASVRSYCEFGTFLWASEVGKVDERGCTALMYAAASRYFDSVTGLQRTVLHDHALRNIVALLKDELKMHLVGGTLSEASFGIMEKRHATVLFPFKPGVTALMIASICDDTVVIPLLLDHEAELRDNTQRTALMWAVECSNTAAVKLLAPREKGLAADNMYRTAMYIAIERGNDAIAKLLVPHEGYPNAEGASRIQGRFTELMGAARKGDFVGVWSYRFQLGLQDERGYTALMYACESGDENCILHLRDEEHLIAKDGTTARAVAEQRLRKTKPHIPAMLDAVELLDEHRRNQLERALIARDVSGIMKFVHLNDKLKGDEDVTILMRIAELGLADTAEMIVTEYPEYIGRIVKAYQVTKVIWEDVSALMIAAARGHDGVVKVLARTNEVKLRDGLEGRTALMAAAINNHPDSVRLLLETEARIQSYEGWTALMYSAAYNLVNVAEVLLEAEARLQMKDGWTALMTAAKNGHIEIATLLLPYEGGMLKGGKYPALYYAATHRKHDMVQLLLGSEAEVKLFQSVIDAMVKRNARDNDEELREAIELFQASLHKLKNTENAT